MERKRFYKLGIKKKKDPAAGNNKGKKDAQAGEEDDSDGEHDDEDDDEDEEDIAKQPTLEELQQELFGYIDESGQVVYIEAEPEDEEEWGVVMECDNNAAEAAAVTTALETMTVSQESANAVIVTVTDVVADDMEVVEPVVDTNDIQLTEESLATVGSVVAFSGLTARSAATTTKKASGNAVTDATTAVEVIGHHNIATYFKNQISPCPRINPCLIIK